MKTIKIVSLCLCFLVFTTKNFVLTGQTREKAESTGYAEAAYIGLSDNAFLTKWMVLGPVLVDKNNANPDGNKQKTIFDQDILTKVNVQSKKKLADLKINDSIYTWKPANFEDGMVDFSKLFGDVDFCYAYALAEIKMENPAKVIVGVGSDDAIKIFLNGKLVHENWIPRALSPDEDVLTLDLAKGSNQILIKVQDMQYDWGFCIRKPGKDMLTKALIASSAAGNLANARLLVENGADFNQTNNVGLTAYQVAAIKGRDKIMEYLKEKGAKTDIPMPPLDKFVDNIFKNAQSGAVPGVAVLITKNGKTIYERSFGYADIGNKVPVTSDTKFRIGSITKQFVASAILKLQEEGKVNVNDKLSKYLPDFPRADEVTIHRLLTHTSGIHSYTNRPDFLKYTTLYIKPASLIDTIKAYPYDFNPGERYLYNNSGFFILGYLVEKISGKSLNEYLTENFFKPLGMNNTGIYETNKLLSNEAYGYTVENDMVSKALNWDMSWAGGAGALYSTVKDLNTWNEAVFNGKVLSKKSQEAAFTPVELNNMQKVDYGYGWDVSKYRGVQFISHGGGLNGFLSMLSRHPETKTNVVILCNATPPPTGIDPGGNAQQILEYMFWQKMVNQSSFDSDFKVNEKILKSYVGKYDYGMGVILTVTIEGNQLYAQLTGQDKYPIYPSSNELFQWKIVEASIKFVTDDKGVVTHAIHSQGGQQFEVKKIE